jgi:hypothetical protein
MGMPKYRFWFLVGSDDITRLAIESTTGTGFVGTSSPSAEDVRRKIAERVNQIPFSFVVGLMKVE